MPTIEKEIKIFKIVYLCDVCKNGHMIFTGNTDTNAQPNLFQHRCEKCDFPAVFTKMYPVYETKEI